MKKDFSDPVVRHFPRAGMVSVIVPVFNEEEVIPAFHHRLCKALDLIPEEQWEILYVNDGSTDRTLRQILGFMAGDARVQVIDFSRNFGKEAAMTAGIDHARGDAAIFIDADLQDPPELIPEMVRHWRKGYDVVNMKRATRAGESWVKRSTAQAFYSLMGRIGPVEMPENVGDFRLLSRRALDALGRMPERNRMMKGMFAWIGFAVKEVSFDREARDAGTTKWNYFRLWNLAIEGVTSFTVAPLKAASVAGILVSLAAFLYGAVVVIRTMVWGAAVPVNAPLMVVGLFLGGIQLLSMGIIGEYLGRVFMETKNRPLYIVKRHHTAARGIGALHRVPTQRRLP